MMIESRKSPLEPLLGNTSPDAAWIDSQIGVLKSLNIASYVVKQLRLADDPEFIRSGRWARSTSSWLGSVGAPQNQKQNRNASAQRLVHLAADLTSNVLVQAT